MWEFFSKLHYFLQKQEIQLIFEDREGGAIGRLKTEKKV